MGEGLRGSSESLQHLLCLHCSELATKILKETDFICVYIYIFLLLLLLLLLLLFAFSRAVAAAHGGFQARGLIAAAAAMLGP